MRLFLCGDVMTGRGIDQALPHPMHPNLYEPCVRDAREYVALAEKANGPIPRPLSFEYIWGDALPELERAEVDLRIANLETAVTSAETPWPEKEFIIGCILRTLAASLLRRSAHARWQTIMFWTGDTMDYRKP